MKQLPIICIGLLFIAGPMQQRVGPEDTQAACLKRYWLNKTRKELLRTQQSQVLQAIDNSLHFVTQKSIKQLLPFFGQ